MWVDVEELEKFYHSPLSNLVLQAINAFLYERLTHTKNQTILGLGFTYPYLAPFLEEVERLLLFMLRRQGAFPWPKKESNLVALVDETMLPLANDSIDVCFVMHCYEFMSDPHLLLKEIWRVLKCHGKVILCVPSKFGLWNKVGLSPFKGCSGSTLLSLMDQLDNASFMVTHMDRALYTPPCRVARIIRMAPHIEKIAKRYFSFLSSLYLIEARKSLLGLVPVQATRLEPKVIAS